ncbi:hypothetical protein ACH5RR_011861 [Cinchona calisaya]|uniref:Homeobox domain-containing protein n=1 Tax=Cinchona calisaya TaxID=153742 RepID=A0ABD3A9Q3_9GENT
MPSKQRLRGSFSTKHGKEKGKSHTSLNFEDEEVYTPSYVEEPIHINKKASKRPASSLDNSFQKGSRSTKLVRSSGDPFIECATNMSRLSAMRIEEKQARYQMDEKYSCEKSMVALNAVGKELPNANRPLHGWNNVSGRYDSSDEDDELMELATFVLFGSGIGMHASPPLRIPCRTSALNGRARVHEILHGYFARIMENDRITVDMFMKLCDILVSYGFVSQNPQKRVQVEEGLAMTLILLSHNHRQRLLSERVIPLRVNTVFGSELKNVGPVEFSGSIAIPLPIGSVLVLNENGADVAKHCVPAVPTKSFKFYSIMEPQQQQQLPNEDGCSSKSSFLCRQSSTRWAPTTEQIRILKDVYYNNGVRSPTAEQIEKISTKLRQYGKIEGKNVFYWFQNHKARERQKKRLITTEISTMQRDVWRSDHQDSMYTPKYFNNNPGAPSSSSAAVPVVHATTQVGNYGYGSLAMEKSFRDCTISPGGNGGNGTMVHNFSWAGLANPSYTSQYQFLEKKSCFVETLDEEEEEEEKVQEVETLPLFPMHGEDITGFSTNRQQEPTYWYLANASNTGCSRASLELRLNSYGGRSQNSP